MYLPAARKLGKHSNYQNLPKECRNDPLGSNAQHLSPRLCLWGRLSFDAHKPHFTFISNTLYMKPLQFINSMLSKRVNIVVK